MVSPTGAKAALVVVTPVAAISLGLVVQPGQPDCVKQGRVTELRKQLENGDFRLQASSPCMPDSLLGCGLVGAYGQGCSGDTLVVDPEGEGTYPTVQAALGSCGAWGVIQLVDGTFTGDGNRDIELPAWPLTICSKSGDPSACLIGGQDTPPSSHFAFRFQEGQGQEVMIRGIGLVGFHSLSLGGALQCPDGSPRIAGCLITGNSANEGGGALWCGAESAPQLIRCTLSGNQAPLGGGVYCEDEARPALQNCIVAFSPAGTAVYCDGDAAPVLSCCDLNGNDGGDWVGCVYDQRAARGNFCVDPCFCDELGENYFLYRESRCAGAYGSCGMVGAMPIGCEGGECELYSSVRGGRNPAVQRRPLCRVPNPFTPGDRVAYGMPETAGKVAVTLAVHDAGGRLIRLLVDRAAVAGEQAVSWSGTDHSGRPVPAGLYFCRLRVGEQTAVRPFLIVR